MVAFDTAIKIHKDQVFLDTSQWHDSYTLDLEQHADDSSPLTDFTPNDDNCAAHDEDDHYQGHWLSATSFLINATGNASVRTAATAAIDTLEAVMGAWRAKYGAVHDGYLFPYDPVVFERLLSGHGARPWYSVPFYTLHKLMAGLLDQYVFAGSAKAFQMVLRMAAWVRRHVEATIARLSPTVPALRRARIFPCPKDLPL